MRIAIFYNFGLTLQEVDLHEKAWKRLLLQIQAFQKLKTLIS
jgi:hypothetical protein